MTTHPVDSPNVTMGAAIPAYVRIRDTDPVRRDCHHADALVCRTDAVSETLLKSGWFKVQPDLIAPALQRALLSGACTDGMERTLDIAIENLSVGSATLPGMTNTQITSTDHFPIPAGAVSVDDDWCMGARAFYGSVSRTIEASGWLLHDVRIYTTGVQNDDGTCSEWVITAGEVHPDMPLNAAQARQIGEALIAAADELDALGEGRYQITTFCPAGTASAEVVAK